MSEWIERVRVGEPQWMYMTMCRYCGRYGTIVAFWYKKQDFTGQRPAPRPLCGECADDLEQMLAMDRMVNG